MKSRFELSQPWPYNLLVQVWQMVGDNTHLYKAAELYQKLEIWYMYSTTVIGSGDRGPWPPTFAGQCSQKNRDTLIEQSVTLIEQSTTISLKTVGSYFSNIVKKCLKYTLTASRMWNFSSQTPINIICATISISYFPKSMLVPLLFGLLHRPWLATTSCLSQRFHTG